MQNCVTAYMYSELKYYNTRQITIELIETYIYIYMYFIFYIGLVLEWIEDLLQGIVGVQMVEAFWGN